MLALSLLSPSAQQNLHYVTCCPAGDVRGEAAGRQGGRGDGIPQGARDPVPQANRLNRGE